MTDHRLLIGLSAFLTLVAAGTLWIPLSRMTLELAAAPVPGLMEREQRLRQRLQSVPEPRGDVYGNEIDKAYAEYQFDTDGALYELHSPETAVLELQPPEI